MQAAILERETNLKTHLETISIFETTTRTAEYLRARLMNLDAIRSRAQSALCALRHEASFEMVDVREYSPRVEILSAPPWSDAERRFLVRPELARRLNNAARLLPSGFRLGYWEGFRPLEVQHTLWENGMTLLRDSYPDLDEHQLDFILETYVARPNSEAPHTQGRAVDVAILDSAERICNGRDETGRAALEKLSIALSSAGLSNYEPEWWHWSLVDETEYSH
jgi:D-alanyl-D-alanine dipeptidase